MRLTFLPPAAALLAALPFAAVPAAFAQTALPPPPRGWVELETGPVWVGRNDVQIPPETGTRFSLRQLVGGGPYFSGRVNAAYDLSARHGLRAVYAPFQISETGRLGQPVRFVSTDFGADAPVEGTYKFNSYRLTYRYRLRPADARSDWRVGLTLKIRDAKIALRQGDRHASDSDLGIVPLLHVSGERRLGDRWAFLLDFDGLAAPQGRAFDLALKAGYDFAPGWRLTAGYRTLEGGADNDRLYTFAWLHYAVVGVVRRF